MITTDYCRTMAEYNQWMNSRLYALCENLPEPDLYADRGAFFKSIYGTLNHIMYADLAFLSRFTGDPAIVPELGVDLFGGFKQLHQERTLLDTRLLAWSETLSPTWLAEMLSYKSKVDGLVRTLPKWMLVTHTFNHQTHHRGQITTLLTQMSIDIGATDITFMPHLQGSVQS
ncbi:MAG TPA: DinB family protein [Gammaproteobacteria bacterium]|nr:DinB family protein [Gammaproteobacteria bacterium]